MIPKCTKLKSAPAVMSTLLFSLVSLILTVLLLCFYSSSYFNSKYYKKQINSHDSAPLFSTEYVPLQHMLIPIPVRHSSPKFYNLLTFFSEIFILKVTIFIEDSADYFDCCSCFSAVFLAVTCNSYYVSNGGVYNGN